LAAGVGPGDEIIVPSFTFAATANSVSLTGATPIFVDIEPNFFCLNPNSVEAAISNRTKGILPVHLYGHPANMKTLKQICDKYKLVIFEDAAQAHLASVDGKKVGTWGLAGSFSFYPTKNMTSGEGGMVTTNDLALANKVRLLRNQGQKIKYKNEIVGFNNRMSDLHAAIGRVQLNKLINWTEQRQSTAAFYNKNLYGVTIPAVMDNAVHVYHQYTIRIKDLDRDRFSEELDKLGVGNAVYYPIPTHRLGSFNLHLDLPETDRATKEVLSLPIHPNLSQENIEKVVSAVNRVASTGVGSG
jgi:dTDP-4-amino-4,6-dideoxygalactose transaminase